MHVVAVGAGDAVEPGVADGELLRVYERMRAAVERVMAQKACRIRFSDQALAIREGFEAFTDGGDERGGAVMVHVRPERRECLHVGCCNQVEQRIGALVAQQERIAGIGAFAYERIVRGIEIPAEEIMGQDSGHDLSPVCCGCAVVGGHCLACRRRPSNQAARWSLSALHSHPTIVPPRRSSAGFAGRLAERPGRILWRKTIESAKNSIDTCR